MKKSTTFVGFLALTTLFVINTPAVAQTGDANTTETTTTRDDDNDDHGTWGLAGLLGLLGLLGRRKNNDVHHPNTNPNQNR